MRRSTRRLIQSSAVLVLASMLMPLGATADPAAPELGPLDVGLLLLKLSPRDLRVKPNYTEDRVGDGKLRLNHVSDGLRSVVGSTRVAMELGEALTTAPNVSRSYETLAGLLDYGSIGVAPPPGALHETAPLAVALQDPGGREGLDPTGEAPEGIWRLPLELRQALAEIVYGTSRANTLYARAVRGLAPEDEAAIRTVLPALLGQQLQLAEADVLEALRIAAKLDLRPILSGAATLLGSIEAARENLRALSAADQEYLASQAAAQETVYSVDTEFGAIVIAGTRDDTHNTPVAILLDLGGSDRYELDAPEDGTTPPVRVVIDLDGDDTYSSRASAAVGASLLGISFLIDEAGADLYETRETLSFGAGICGVGVLIDRDGDDRYFGDILTQGAGMFGLGLLVDEAGDDIYDAALCAQGFGCVRGIGALVDVSGTDRYRAGSKYSVSAQGEAQMLALSQGFGLGLRPWAPGGVGIIADAEGGDNYMADARSQGTGWWYGSGLLFDATGDDQYQGGQFSQGTGNFLATGHLLDMDGSDGYEAPVFCQGFARDWGIGVLRDAAGDDSYVATQMAQGAATRNAIAIAVDLLGDDTYSSREDSQGYVPPGRHSSTIGLFGDGGGNDLYAGRNRDNLCWFTGRLGVGIDVTDGDLTRVKARVRGAARVPGDFNFGPVPIAPVAGTTDTGAELEALYEQATEAENPVDRQKAIAALTRIGEDAAEFITPKLSERKRATVDDARNVLAEMGSQAVPALLRVMEEGETEAAAAAMKALADIGDPRAAKKLVEQAKHERWRIRAAAAGGMGSLTGEDTRLALEQLLNDVDEDVRRSAITALRRRGSSESAIAISDKLGDPAFSVRFAAADALVSMGVRCPDHVFSLVGAGDPAIRLLSIETCGRLSSTRSVDMLLKLLRSDDWSDRAFASAALCYVGAPRACEDLQAALAAETNGLVKAKAEAAIRATKFCVPNP